MDSILPPFIKTVYGSSEYISRNSVINHVNIHMFNSKYILRFYKTKLNIKGKIKECYVINSNSNYEWWCIVSKEYNYWFDKIYNNDHLIESMKEIPKSYNVYPQMSQIPSLSLDGTEDQQKEAVQNYLKYCVDLKPFAKEKSAEGKDK